MARHKTANTEARLTTEPCVKLGIWIIVDGKVTDIIHYSDLRDARRGGEPIVNQETIDAIDEIYADFRIAREEEE